MVRCRYRSVRRKKVNLNPFPGLGGTFLLREGSGKYHVMPDFSSTKLCTESDVDNWMHYFVFRAPIVHVGTLITGDLVRIKTFVS